MFALHGFHDLAVYASGPSEPSHDQSWQRIIESWLAAAHQPALPAWHPFPTSQRLVAWSSAIGAIVGWPQAFRRRVAGEIERQARYLRRAIEQDIGGNHVLINAKGLIFAGVTVPSSGVLRFGLRLLERELARQILADGGHEERTTSYHRVITHDLAEIAMLLDRAGTSVPDWLETASRRTEHWLTELIGPDGYLPMLNDAWEGPPLDRPSVAREPMTLLPDTGHVVLRHGTDQAIFDCGALCPEHLPAHAHADALSFVLWMDGRAVIVDPGTYTYTGPYRNHFRSTAAHSTVEIDGRDQCVFWGDHRASFLPRVEPPRIRSDGATVAVESSHDGYRRLDDQVVHHRSLLWIPNIGVVIVDQLRCRLPHTIRSGLPLAPDLTCSGGQVANLGVAPLTTGGSVAEERSLYSPLFGQAANTVSIVERRTVQPGERFGWSLLRAGSSASIMENTVAVRTEGSREPLRIPLRRVG